jgi:hypothetical protein
MNKGETKSIPRLMGLGAVSGICGTIAMDLLWYRRYLKSGGNEDIGTWEFARSVTGWDNAPAPGKAAAKLFQFVARQPAPDSWARPTTNIVHWLTGAAWGVQYSVLRGNAGRGRWALGFFLGPTAWVTSYAVLPLLGLYRPIWEYDARTLAEDLSAHMLYGIVTAGTREGLS